jgi:hypothetical protein
MAPATPLPLSDEWKDPDSYIDSLLSFATSTHLFMNLCGGVHVLDFLTREPDLYTTLLPEDWRQFFEAHDIQDILHLLMREDLSQFESEKKSGAEDTATTENVQQQEKTQTWKGGPAPPTTLLDYIRDIRRFSLRREFTAKLPSSKKSAISRRLAVGMKTKKLHEVENFSHYVDSLATNVTKTRGGGEPITHIVDFGSGQNYLGRTLASPPYNRHVIAIERKHAYIRGAQGMDVNARLAEKEVVRWNKKEYNQKLRNARQNNNSEATPPSSLSEEVSENDSGSSLQQPADPGCCPDVIEKRSNEEEEEEDVKIFNVFREIDLDADDLSPAPDTRNDRTKPQAKPNSRIEPLQGSMHYIEHEIQDGYLEPIIRHVVEPANHSSETEPNNKDERTPSSNAKVMVVSLHSCGNLLHHGVRSLVLNPSVIAIAMIGCCYNLMTERLGPVTYKLPILRSQHPRLEQTSTAYDPHGFPMSKRLEEYQHLHGAGTGIKLNITARMMAVQAPYNWGSDDSEAFFTRHFYRALLQRVLMDYGIVPKHKPVDDDSTTTTNNNHNNDNDSENTPPRREGPSGTPLIVGSLRKSAYASFPTYAQAALTRLSRTDPIYGAKISTLLTHLPQKDLERYARDYAHARKKLSIVWSLMGFSAAVVEAIIVVDRWQFLREHIPLGIVKDCWVEPVFEYRESPRNLVVVGVK